MRAGRKTTVMTAAVPWASQARAKIIVPGTLPYVLAGMRISLALALVVTVVSEMIAGASGVGYYLVLMQYAVRSADMYAAIFVIAALGCVLNAVFVAIERRLIFWYAQQP